MSYLLFGAIRLVTGVRTYDDQFAYSLVQAGHLVGIYVYIRSNIPQPQVMQVLQEQELLDNDYVPFMIAQSSMCDTAHELIAPYVEPEWSLEVARDAWQRICLWSDVVLGLANVSTITLFVGEADETEFSEVYLASDQLTNLIVKEIEATGFVPQLCVHLQRPVVDSSG